MELKWRPDRSDWLLMRHVPPLALQAGVRSVPQLFFSLRCCCENAGEDMLLPDKSSSPPPAKRSKGQGRPALMGRLTDALDPGLTNQQLSLQMRPWYLAIRHWTTETLWITKSLQNYLIFPSGLFQQGLFRTTHIQYVCKYEMTWTTGFLGVIPRNARNWQFSECKLDR